MTGRRVRPGKAPERFRRRYGNEDSGCAWGFEARTMLQKRLRRISYPWISCGLTKTADREDRVRWREVRRYSLGLQMWKSGRSASSRKLKRFPRAPKIDRFLGIADRQSWERCARRSHRPTRRRQSIDSRAMREIQLSLTQLRHSSKPFGSPLAARPRAAVTRCESGWSEDRQRQSPVQRGTLGVMTDPSHDLENKVLTRRFG